MLAQLSSVMGNNLFAGYVWSMLGGAQAEDKFNFDQTKIKPLMKQFKMTPWSAVADLKLIKRRVQLLVHHNQLSKIDVKKAKEHYEKSIGGWLPQHRLSRTLFMKETNKLVQKEGKFMSARDYDVLDDLFTLLDVDKSEELEAPEFALGLRLVFAGKEDEKLRMAFKMIDRDDDEKISKKEIHRFLLPYMNIIVPAGAEILRPLLAWYCAETCMKNVAKFLGKDKIDEAPLEDFVKFCQSHDIVFEAAEQIDKKVYEIWLELEHESAFFARKDARKQGGAVRQTMSELPMARNRARQDSAIFLEAVMGSTLSTDVAVDSRISNSVSMISNRPETCTKRGLQDSSPELAVQESLPAASVEACRPPSPPRNTADISKSPEIQRENSDHARKEVSKLTLPAPPPSAAQLSVQMKSAAAVVEQPRQNAVARGPVVPRLQMAQPTTFAQIVQPTAFALQSPRPCHFSSSQMQMSPGVVSSSVPQVHTVMASPRVLSKATSHVSAVSVNPPSRGASFQATPRSVSMQSCRSTTQAPLPTLLGVHRCQPEVKSKILD